MKFACGGLAGLRSRGNRRPNHGSATRNAGEQIKRLQRCINDLVSVLALPAMWSGGEPAQIVDSLLDALLGMLQLDFVYVRVNDPVGGAPIEVARVAPSQNLMPQPHEICKAGQPMVWRAIRRNGLAVLQTVSRRRKHFDRALATRAARPKLA